MNKAERNKIITGQRFKRPVKVRAENFNDEERTVEIAFSSNSEIERSFGIEILDHEAASVRLARLNDGAPLLVNHDTNDQVGVVESARIDGGAVGRAIVRFSRSNRGQEIFNDVKDGIRKLVSVGYQIHKYEVDETEKTEKIRATDWEPYELSIVPIPADLAAGVGRSDQANLNVEKTMTIETKETEQEQKTETRAKPTFDIQVEKEKTRKAEQARMKKIRSAAEANNLEELGARAIDEDWDYSKFNEAALDEIGKRNNKARSATRETGNVDLSHKEESNYSIVRLMNALSNPNDREAQKRAGLELEASDAGVKQFGNDFKARGAFIPDNVLNAKRDLTVGVAAAGGNLVGTNLVAGSFIDLLRSAQLTAQMGVQTLSGLVGNIALPRQTGGAAMTWITAEDGDSTESEPTFDQVPLTPKDASVFTEVGRRLIQQSTPGVEGLVRADIAQAFGLGTDAAILYGSGAAGQPTGIANATGINTVTFAGADPTYAEIIAMIKEVMIDNALLGSLGWMIDPQGWEALSTTEKFSGTGKTILDDQGKIGGYNYGATNQVTAEDYFFGNWGSVVVGEWGGIELNVDPYTHSLKGKVRFVGFKTMDIALRQPGSFVLGNDTP